MKKILLVLSIIILTGFAYAGNGNGTGDCTGTGSGSGSAVGSTNGQGGNGMGVSLYDLSTETTISGTITSFYSVNADAINPTNPVITLEDGSEVIVQTGPSWFMDSVEFSLEIGDVIAVTGSLQTNADGLSVIVAKEIAEGENILILRDELGYPVWQGIHGMSQGGSRNPGTYTNLLYDVESETNLTATVDSVLVGSLEPGTYPGYQLIVTTTEGNTLNVMLAPYWYLANQDFSLEEGMQINLTGVSVVLESGLEVFVARLIQYDDVEIILRDEAGLPLWSGVRRK